MAGKLAFLARRSPLVNTSRYTYVSDNCNGSISIRALENLRVGDMIIKNHAVIVDGLDEYGHLIVRDPATRYSFTMRVPEFERFWDGEAVTFR